MVKVASPTASISPVNVEPDMITVCLPVPDVIVLMIVGNCEPVEHSERTINTETSCYVSGSYSQQ